MSDPVLRAFFLGRALAQAVGEQVEASISNSLSELAKFDAEQRERLRQFSEQVMEKAARDADAATATGGSTVSSPFSSAPSSAANDLQVTIDDLRAEIARLRAELQFYRNSQL